MNVFLVFPYFSVSIPCARLSWPYRQLLSARKYIVLYRIVSNKQSEVNEYIRKLILYLYIYHSIHADFTDADFQ